MYAGVHSTVAFASSNGCRRSPTAISQSSVTRQISGVSQVEAARLVDGRQHRQVVDLSELEVLLARPGRDVDDARALLERDLVPGDDAVLDLAAGAEVVEGAAVAKADELLAECAGGEPLVRIPGDRDPLAVLPPTVLRVGLHRRRDVRGQCPGRRRPDHERLVER